MPSIEGVYAAVLTPRRPDTRDLNLAVMWDLIDFLCGCGIDGIALFSAAGEFVHYSIEERMRAASLASKRSSLPVLIDVSHSTLDGAIELAQSAFSSGAAGVLLMPPYFFRYGQDSILEFYRKFAAHSGIPIPVLLHNEPRFTNPVEYTTAAALLRQGIVNGVVDSSGEWQYLREMIALGRESGAVAMTGSDRLFLQARTEGAAGVVSSVAGAIPELMAALNRIPAPEQSPLAHRLSELAEWMDRLPATVAIKAIAGLRGWESGPPAVPLSPESEQTARDFRDQGQGWLAMVLDESKRF